MSKVVRRFFSAERWARGFGVLFAGGEVMLLAPLRAGAAHVVQLGAIGVENGRALSASAAPRRCPISRAKVPTSAKSVEIAAPVAIIWRAICSPLPFWNLDAFGFLLL
jgi:hypothetical protein